MIHGAELASLSKSLVQFGPLLTLSGSARLVRSLPYMCDFFRGECDFYYYAFRPRLR